MDTIELVEANPALAEFKRGDVKLLELVTKYSGLKINGLADRTGYKAVHDARMECRRARIDIEGTRKQLKENVLAYGRAVDGEAKRLTAIIEPVELALAEQETAIDKEKENIRLAEEKARNERIQKRFAAFHQIGEPAPADVGNMTEEDYQAEYAKAVLVKAQKDEAIAAEKKRLADEAEARRKEREELDRVRAEQDAIRKAQEAKEAELKAHQQRIADQEAAQRRAAELEEAKKKAAEEAVAAEKERAARLKREADEYEAQRLAENARLAKEAAEAKAKADAEMPQRDKILAFADAVAALATAEKMVLLSRPYGATAAKIEKIIVKAAADIRKLANGPLE